MRSVSFVDRLSLAFSGEVMRNALHVGDVDNDTYNELTLATCEGSLIILKSMNPEQIWRQTNGLGHVSCVEVGDLINIGRNELIVVAVDGYVYIFDVHNDDAGILEPFHRQRIVANVKASKVLTLDSPKHILAVVLSDMVVRTYEWKRNSNDENALEGALQTLNKFEFGGQVGGMTDFPDLDGVKNLVITQPGGVLLKVTTETQSEYKRLFSYEPDLKLYDHVSAEIEKVQVCHQGEVQLCLAMATLDGMFKIFSKTHDILYQIQTNQQLQCLRTMRFNNEDSDRIVITSWSGNTFIVVKDEHALTWNVTEFLLDERVSAFACGHFFIDRNENSADEETKKSEQEPVMVFASLDGRILIYYNIDVPKGSIKSLLQFEPTCDVSHLVKSKADMVRLNSCLLYSNELTLSDKS